MDEFSQGSVFIEPVWWVMAGKKQRLSGHFWNRGRYFVPSQLLRTRLRQTPPAIYNNMDHPNADCVLSAAGVTPVLISVKRIAARRRKCCHPRHFQRPCAILFMRLWAKEKKWSKLRSYSHGTWRTSFINFTAIFCTTSSLVNSKNYSKWPRVSHESWGGSLS